MKVETIHTIINSKYNGSVYLTYADNSDVLGTLNVKWKLNGIHSNSDYYCSPESREMLISSSVNKATVFESRDDSTNLQLNSVETVELFITTNSGHLFFVKLLSTGGSTEDIGRTRHDIVWIGNVQIYNDSLICVAQSTGDCMVSRKSSSGKCKKNTTRFWNHFKVKDSIISCCTVDSNLVTSDRTSVSVHNLEISQPTMFSDCSIDGCLCKTSINVVSKNVPINGVMGLCYSERKLNIQTVDGRSLSYTLADFLKMVPSSVTRGTVTGGDVDSIIRKINEYSDEIKTLEDLIDNCAAFIKQLNMATCLRRATNSSTDEEIAIDMKSRFNLTYDIELSSTDEFIFNMNISMKNSLTVVQFLPKWWYGTISLNYGPQRQKNVTFKLSYNDFSNRISIPVSVQDIKTALLTTVHSSSNYSCHINYSISLKSFTNDGVICSVPLITLPLKMSSFLSNFKSVTSLTNEPCSFTHFLKNSDPISQTTNFEVDVKISLVLNIEKLLLILNISQMIKDVNSNHTLEELTKKFPLKNEVWFCDMKCSIEAVISSNTVNVTLSSTCFPLMVAIKRELEQIEDMDFIHEAASKVSLNKNILHQMSQIKLMLDLALDPSNIHYLPFKSLYKQICLLSSSLPI